MKVREALPEYEGQGYFELLDHVYQTGESYRITEMSSLLKAADGTLVERFFSAIFQPWYDVDGQIAGVLNFAVEVTEQVRTRRQLEESEKRFRALADAMPQMVWTAGPDGVLDYCNQRWLEYTGMEGYDPAQGFRPFVHPDDLPIALVKWHHALESGQIFEVECRYRRGRDGSYRWHLARALPVRDGNGAIVKWYGTTTDIDDQKRTEEALRRSEASLIAQARELELANSELRHHRDELMQANVDLEKADRGRQFFSTMSHELRTPLASIIGFSQLLLADAEETHWTQQQKSNLERTLKNGQHLLNLINDVLDLVKIEAGRMEISFSQVDVPELITWVVEETSSLAAEKKLDVSIAIEDEVMSIESNPVKLRQILLNLVSNALKYTERGGVTISAARVGEDQLVLAVKDTGIGISEEGQERIFEAFYQVDGGYTRKSSGTGLGLAIVSQLTSLLGGKIELESAPGQGSAFTVILPVKPVTRRGEQDILRSGWEDGNSTLTGLTPFKRRYYSRPFKT
jgi:PAS domain S-box-containing protein